MYGCNTRNPDYVGRKDLHYVQDGYIELVNETGLTVSIEPNYVWIRDHNSKDCKYDRWQTDPKCAGCERERL